MIKNVAFSHFGYFSYLQINFSPVFYAVVSLVYIKHLQTCLNCNHITQTCNNSKTFKFSNLPAVQCVCDTAISYTRQLRQFESLDSKYFHSKLPVQFINTMTSVMLRAHRSSSVLLLQLKLTTCCSVAAILKGKRGADLIGYD